METMRLKLSDIIADEKFNARKKYDPEIIEELARSIKKNGQLNPVLVVHHPTKSGKFFLISGFTRYKAFEQIESELKEGEAPPTVFTQLSDSTDKLDQYLLNLGENIQRRDLSPYDIATRVTELSDEFDLKAPQIGSRVGLGAKHVANLIRIVKNVKPEILELWRDHDGKGNPHPKANTVLLTKLAAMEPSDQQNLWDEVCGVVPEDDEDGEDESGTGASNEPSEKRRRPSETILAAAIVAVQEADIKDGEKKAMLQALRFAIGKAKTIPGVFNPASASKKRPSANGEAEAQA